jgi:hypothetical protein
LTPAELEEMAAMTIPLMLTFSHDRNAAMIVLQSHAARNQLSAAATKTYIAYVQQRLASLTPEDAAAFGIDEAKYDLWRTQYFGPGGRPSTGAVGATGTMMTEDHEY